MGELDSIDDELFAERIFPIGLVPPSLPEPPTVRFVEPPEPPRDRDPIMAIVTARCWSCCSPASACSCGGSADPGPETQS